MFDKRLAKIIALWRSTQHEGERGAAGLAELVDPAASLKFIPSILADKTCGLFAAIAASST